MLTKRKSMLAFKIRLLLLSSKELPPYRGVSVICKSLLSKMFLLYLIAFRKVDLSLEWWGQWRRKWAELSVSISQLQIGVGELWKPCLNLCSRRWLKPSLNLVSNLSLMGLWELKTLFPEGRINLRGFSWKYSNFLNYK